MRKGLIVEAKTCVGVGGRGRAKTPARPDNRAGGGLSQALGARQLRPAQAQDAAATATAPGARCRRHRGPPRAPGDARGNQAADGQAAAVGRQMDTASA